MKTSLQPLSTPEAQHSEALVQRMRGELEHRGGWMSFERFMEMALYEPGLGYYSAGARKFGAGGDFVTAPEMSALFGRCLAQQCAEILQALGGGEILELGAGSGVMAADVLGELEQLGQLPTRYRILEVSADLQERQRALLAERRPALRERIEWLDALPSHFSGVILANEVLDALPVQRFVISNGQVNALGVSWRSGKLELAEVRADAELENAVRSVEDALGQRFPDNYASEINLRLDPWIRGLASALAQGVVLLIDYGLPCSQYYHSERNRGTLLCHFRQCFHEDALVHIGLQDIGAWVDFTAVAHAAVSAGLQVAGFATQTHFLIGAGIERLLADLADKPLEQRVQLARQAMLLTLPGEMGERFKVIGLTQNYSAPLCGFSVRDLAASL